MPPATSIRVFVSSAMAELEYDREIASEALRDLNVSPILFEVFPAMSQSPLESCLEEVRSSDIFVMLLWRSFSRAVEEEYAEALKRGKPIVVLIKSLNENEKRDAGLKRFLKAMTAGSEMQAVRRVTWKHYRPLRELRGAIRESIGAEIAKFYKEPIQTLGREEMYELGTSIVRYAQKRLYLFQRTPSLILGARDYLADEASKYPREKEFADALDRWIRDNCGAADKEFLCLFSAEATRREMLEQELHQHSQYINSVKKRVEWVTSIGAQTGFRFRVRGIEIPMSGPLIVGDNRYAMWLLGKDDAVSISQENEKVCDILVRTLKFHSQRPTNPEDVFAALGLT